MKEVIGITPVHCDHPTYKTGKNEMFITNALHYPLNIHK